MSCLLRRRAPGFPSWLTRSRQGSEKIITKNGESYVALIDAERLDHYHRLERERIHWCARRRRARAGRRCGRAHRGCRRGDCPPKEKNDSPSARITKTTTQAAWLNRASRSNSPPVSSSGWSRSNLSGPKPTRRRLTTSCSTACAARSSRTCDASRASGGDTWTSHRNRQKAMAQLAGAAAWGGRRVARVPAWGLPDPLHAHWLDRVPAFHSPSPAVGVRIGETLGALT